MDPFVGGSKAPSMYNRVLLPLPEGPMIETASPRDRESEMSESICSAPRGVGYSFETFSTFSKRQSPMLTQCLSTDVSDCVIKSDHSVMKSVPPRGSGWVRVH